MPRLSPEQKAARRRGIGSSDVPVILGLSPYADASPLALYLDKIGELGTDDDVDETIEQRVGHAVEGALVRLYEEESGFKVATVGTFVESVRHPEHDWRVANLDARIVDKRAALEIKAVGIGMARDWDLGSDDGIPHYVRAQVAWQMHVADLDEVHVVAMVGGPSGFRVFYVQRDVELERLIVEQASAFWAKVQAREQPELDGSDVAREYLDRKYPPREGDVVVDVSDDAALVELGAARLQAHVDESTAKERKATLSNKLVAAMGERAANVLTCDAWRATYKADRNGRRSLLIKDRRDPKMRNLAALGGDAALDAGGPF